MSEQQAKYKIDPLKPCPQCKHYPFEYNHGELVYCANEKCIKFKRLYWRHDWQAAK